MLSKNLPVPIKDAFEYEQPGARRSWWQRTIMQKLSFALLVFAVWSALLSSCLSTSLFTSASDSGIDARDASFPDLYEASIAELQSGLEKGRFTSEDLVKVSEST
jgi:hypothetical protein